MNPTMRTSPSEAFCTTAGSSPPSLSKSSSAFIRFSGKTKSPLSLAASAGRTCYECWLYQVHPRRHAVRVMVMMAVVEMRLHYSYRIGWERFRGQYIRTSGINCFFDLLYLQFG